MGLTNADYRKHAFEIYQELGCIVLLQTTNVPASTKVVNCFTIKDLAIAGLDGYLALVEGHLAGVGICFAVAHGFDHDLHAVKGHQFDVRAAELLEGSHGALAHGVILEYTPARSWVGSDGVDDHGLGFFR